MAERRLTTSVSGCDIDLITVGNGPTLLFLHGGEGPDVPTDAYIKALAKHFTVIAPWHPGFGRRSRGERLREISDLAYLYLDLVEQQNIKNGVLVGSSFGGWIAAEMMVRNSSAFSQLVLSAPLGIKVRDRESRDIEDVFALTDEEFRAIAYADPSQGYQDLASLSDEDLTGYFRSRESLAFFCWKPYMHNPQLKNWLHRIKIPTLLVSGAKDRVVFDGYYTAYSSYLPLCTHHTLDGAGHFPHVEQTEEFVRILRDHYNVRVAPTASVV
ncbi:hypothetical protein CAK95_02135 [Pseudorhodoplanes sinuspersici]|uniref:AB hydrolase-1 domain-containing protein n=2 Tax=Pseudorhodoplanes sinuspersici TaxID=1235591 RepID=A0A1W6ZLL3_9HYPH|nr:hypothetical protein CAK95_02135 [Pseudorhodoplanes sinuspersici]